MWMTGSAGVETERDKWRFAGEIFEEIIVTTDVPHDALGYSCVELEL